MATAKKLKSGSWRVRVFSHYELEDGIRKPKYKSFTSDDSSNKGKAKAEGMAAEFSLKRKRERIGDFTVAESMKRYIDSKSNVLSPTTINGYKKLEKKAYSSLLDLKTKDLTQEIIQRWTNEYSLGRSPKTVRNAHGFLCSVLAVYEPSLTLSTQLPAPVEPRLYTPSDEDIKALLKHIEGNELEKAVLLSAFGTLRRAEICGLTNEDINGNIITINKEMTKNLEGEWHIKKLKTPASYREIEYPEFVIEKLKDIEGRLVNVNPDALSNRFKRAIKSSGLPHFRLHDLRHYSASIMHAIGIPDQYIIARGGWKTDRVMKRVYRNVISDEQKKFTDKTNAHFNNLLSDQIDTKDNKV